MLIEKNKANQKTTPEVLILVTPLYKMPLSLVGARLETALKDARLDFDDVQNTTNVELEVHLNHLKELQAEFYKETSNILVSTLSDEEEDEAKALLLQVDQFLVLLLKRIAKSRANPCQNEHVSRHKLPNIAFRQFDEDNPMLWFDQLHLQFKAHGVLKEDEKFVLLSGYLSSDQALVVEPITSQAGQHLLPFSAAKTLLLDAYSASTDERLEKAFALEWYGPEEKPSQFMGRFNMLIRDAKMDDIRAWFLRKNMPDNIRLALTKETDGELDKTLKLADVLVQSTSKNTTRHSTNVIKASKPNYVLCPFHAEYGRKSKKCTGSLQQKCPMYNLINKMSGNAKDEQ